jgi:pimeloyl-ACP methyl ester carboxylesterase
MLLGAGRDEIENSTGDPMSSAYRELFVPAADGLRLYARDYGADSGKHLPVVCLPGLARTSEDFHDLALALSTDASRPRRVLALDYRGRGRSDWDPDWRHYDVGVELNDTLQVLAVAGIDRAAFVGTSRGGLITMALAAVRPNLPAGAVLNDVGPVLEAGGLVRIRTYVGKLPQPRDMEEAARILKELSGAQFPRFTDAQWEKQARGTWREDNGRLVLAYDPQLMKVLETLDLDAPLPDLWPLFEGLADIPVLAIRGGHSDLLTAETLQQMTERHPSLTAVTVPDQGHAPVIEGDLIEPIRRLIEQAASRAPATA